MYSVYCIIIALFSVLYCKVPYNIMVQALFIPVNYPCQVSNLYNCSTLIVDIIDLDIIYFLKSRKTSGPSVVHSSNVSRLLISLPNIFSLENTARVSELWWGVFWFEWSQMMMIPWAMIVLSDVFSAMRNFWPKLVLWISRICSKILVSPCCIHTFYSFHMVLSTHVV